jgi:hypothetical protein
MSWDTPSPSEYASGPPPHGRPEAVELVGMHLRMSGVMSLGRFNRLSDLVNYSAGYVRLEDAHLLRRNGDETRLMLAELLVNQDEISFVAQKEVLPGSTGSGGDVSERPSMGRQPRQLVIFTPGHVLTGLVWVHEGSDIASFVDATSPRFVPTKDVTSRSLADRRILSHYPFALVNRTQMIAVSEALGPTHGADGDMSLAAEEPVRI